MASTRPKTRSDLALVEIDGEALIYEPENEGVHYLDPIAFLVFQLCDGKGTVTETVCNIAEAFGAPLEQVDRDVRSCIKEFRRLNLLQAPGKAASPPARAPRRRRKRKLVRLHVPPSS